MPSKLMNKKHKKRFVGDSQWVESVSTRKLKKKQKKKKFQFLTNFIYRKHTSTQYNLWIIHKGNHISIFALCELGFGSDFSDEIHDRKRRNPNHKFLFRLTSKSNSKTLDKSMHVYNYGSLSVVKLGLLRARGRRNVVLVYNCE